MKCKCGNSTDLHCMRWKRRNLKCQDVDESMPNYLCLFLNQTVLWTSRSLSICLPGYITNKFLTLLTCCALRSFWAMGHAKYCFYFTLNCRGRLLNPEMEKWIIKRQFHGCYVIQLNTRTQLFLRLFLHISIPSPKAEGRAVRRGLHFIIQLCL